MKVPLGQGYSIPDTKLGLIIYEQYVSVFSVFVSRKMFGIQIKRAKEIQLKEMESYLQQNANKVDAVAKEKEAGQNQKENRKAQKVRFYHSQVGKILNASPGVQNFTEIHKIISSGDNLSE